MLLNVNKILTYHLNLLITLPQGSLTSQTFIPVTMPSNKESKEKPSFVRSVSSRSSVASEEQVCSHPHTILMLKCYVLNLIPIGIFCNYFAIIWKKNIDKESSGFFFQNKHNNLIKPNLTNTEQKYFYWLN